MGINQSGIRAKTAAEEVNRLRGWKRTEDRFEENKARIKKDCLAVLSGMSSFSWEKYSAALEAKGYKVKLKSGCDRICNNSDRIWDGEFSYIPMIKWSAFINDVNHQIERVEKIRDRADEYDLHIDVDQ